MKRVFGKKKDMVKCIENLYQIVKMQNEEINKLKVKVDLLEMIQTLEWGEHLENS